MIFTYPRREESEVVTIADDQKITEAEAYIDNIYEKKIEEKDGIIKQLEKKLQESQEKVKEKVEEIKQLKNAMKIKDSVFETTIKEYAERVRDKIIESEKANQERCKDDLMRKKEEENRLKEALYDPDWFDDEDNWYKNRTQTEVTARNILDENKNYQGISNSNGNNDVRKRNKKEEIDKGKEAKSKKKVKINEQNHVDVNKQIEELNDYKAI